MCLDKIPIVKKASIDNPPITPNMIFSFLVYPKIEMDRNKAESEAMMSDILLFRGRQITAESNTDISVRVAIFKRKCAGSGANSILNIKNLLYIKSNFKELSKDVICHRYIKPVLLE